MAKVGLVVDGEFDKAAIAVLLRKCRPGLGVEARVAGQSTTKAVRILKELKRLRVRAAVWVKDAEANNPAIVEAKMTNAVRASGVQLKVECVVATPMLEAWLLADDSALRKAFGLNVHTYSNPETIGDPKKELTRLLAASSIPYTAKQVVRIANASNIRTIAQRCPSFKAFQRAIEIL